MSWFESFSWLFSPDALRPKQTESDAVSTFEPIQNNDDKVHRGPREGYANYKIHGVWYSYAEFSIFGLSQVKKDR